MVRVFANGPVDEGSIPGRVIPKIQKCYMSSWLNTQYYKVRGNPGPEKGVAPFPTPRRSSN